MTEKKPLAPLPEEFARDEEAAEFWRAGVVYGEMAGRVMLRAG